MKLIMEKGSSLIELLLVIVVIGMMVYLLASLPNAVLLINKSKHLSLAREIAVKEIEDKRTIQYINLANGNSSINDSRMNLLPQGSGTVTIDDCDLQICTSGESTKQVTAVINWKDNNKTQTITLETLISTGGLNQ